MKIEDISLSTILVAIPLTHLVITGAYLLCYAWGFGANIATFFTVEDLFSTSLAQVAPIYITGLAVPAGITAWRWTWKHPYEADRIAAITHEGRRRIGYLALSLSRWILAVGSVAALIIITIRLVDSYLRAEPMLTVVLTSMAFVLGPLVLSPFANSGKLSWKTYEVLTLVLFFCASAIGSGTFRGQSDRHLAYSDLRDGRPMCAQLVVLRKVADQLLVVDLEGTRRLVKVEDCNGTVTFPRARATGYLRWSWRPVVLLPRAG